MLGGAGDGALARGEAAAALLGAVGPGLPLGDDAVGRAGLVVAAHLSCEAGARLAAVGLGNLDVAGAGDGTSARKPARWWYACTHWSSRLPNSLLSGRISTCIPSIARNDVKPKRAAEPYASGKNLS